MSRLKALYEEMILEHNRNPRHFSKLENPSHYSHGVNPLCGDDYHVYLNVAENKIKEITFEGTGCAISKSSGSLMTEFLKEKTIEDALKDKDAFIKLVTSECSAEEKKALGKLQVFEGVREFPVRVKCAALVWRALEDALENQKGTITTE